MAQPVPPDLLELPELLGPQASLASRGPQERQELQARLVLREILARLARRERLARQASRELWGQLDQLVFRELQGQKEPPERRGRPEPLVQPA